ncbi:MAG: hypothetical protein M3N22_05365 [Acidobacteriota bacterium]|nr:hypothetical protein [Acidobacteriota bacterium]
MKSFRFTTLGTVLLASALPLVGAMLVIVDHPHAASVSPAPELLQSHLDVRTLSGRIVHKGGRYLFHEDKRPLNYFLDDQQEAKRFSGKAVLVTGTIDAKRNIVHIHKIEST